MAIYKYKKTKNCRGKTIFFYAQRVVKNCRYYFVKRQKKISKVSLINLLRFIFYKYKHIDNIIVFINVKNC